MERKATLSLCTNADAQELGLVCSGIVQGPGLARTVTDQNHILQKLQSLPSFPVSDGSFICRTQRDPGNTQGSSRNPGSALAWKSDEIPI